MIFMGIFHGIFHIYFCLPEGNIFSFYSSSVLTNVSDVPPPMDPAIPHPSQESPQ